MLSRREGGSLDGGTPAGLESAADRQHGRIIGMVCTYSLVSVCGEVARRSDRRAGVGGEDGFLASTRSGQLSFGHLWVP